MFEIKEGLWPDLSPAGQIRKLDSRWASRRRAAAVGLASFPLEVDTIVPALTAALSDSDKDVRMAALASLNSFGAESRGAAARLNDLLQHDPDSKIRGSAATLIGQLQG